MRILNNIIPNVRWKDVGAKDVIQEQDEVPNILLNNSQEEKSHRDNETNWTKVRNDIFDLLVNDTLKYH